MTIYFEPFADYLRTSRGKTTAPLAGVFVGGCIVRGEGSSFRASAHAHIAGPFAGWICVRSAKRLYASSGRPSQTMLHELAHIITRKGHTDRFRRVFRELGGRCSRKIVGETKRVRS